MTRLFVIVFFALATCITFTSREQYFRTSDYEEGDDAANALQIHRAKQGLELHGNYSRWGFHHPGPAFFYVYAAGEWILHDATGLMPTARNAHLYTGLLIQLAFFTAAAVLVATRTRQPWLALALWVALGAWHYAFADRTLFSIWPPDVLMMPFLCFVIACAAVASGEQRALPILVVAAGFLFHGHIAQPLFVGPMGLAALIVAAYRWKLTLRGTIRTRPFLSAALLAIAFLVPIAIDATHGKASNLFDVWLHLRYQSDHGKTLFKSLLCYGSYFVGMNDPTMFNVLNERTHVPFMEGAKLLLAWLGTLGFSLWHFNRRTNRLRTDDTARFGRQLIWFWLAGSALTLVWGMRQDGGFTNFNSHFNHSLVHVIAVMGVVTLVDLLPQMSRGFGVTLFAASIPWFVVALPYQVAIGTRGDQIAAGLRALLDADPKPAAPKLIEFTPEVDRVDWYEAVSLARAFQREGIAFYVSPQWRVMFGNDKVFTNQGRVLDGDGISVWTLFSRKSAPVGAHVLNQECSVVFRTPPVFHDFPIAAHATAGRVPELAFYGIDRKENEWCWTIAPVVAFDFTAPAATSDLELTLDASGFEPPAHPAGQRVRVVVNGQAVGEDTFNDQRHTMRVRIAPEIWNARATQTVVLELPDAIAPAYFADSNDRRVLALRLYGLTIVEPPTAQSTKLPH